MIDGFVRRAFYAGSDARIGARVLRRDARRALRDEERARAVRAAQMFELVDRVERIRGSCPGAAARACSRQAGDRKTARIDIDYHGVRAHFTTDNVNQPPTSIVVTLKDGPFRHLHGEWRFRALRADALQGRIRRSPTSSRRCLLDKAIGPVFNHIANTFIDAFVKRAEAVYGCHALTGVSGSPSRRLRCAATSS